MVYKKLLISSGRGIDSNSMKVSTNSDIATLVIGVGGTGIDCLEEVKTRIYRDVATTNGGNGNNYYPNILFWGIDRYFNNHDEDEYDIRNVGTIPLTEEERFSIANPHIRRAFSNPKGLEMREELSWLRWEDLEAPDLTKGPPPSGRQMGRFMFIDRSAQFIYQLREKLKQIIQVSGPDIQINVHIISGLSGTTGGGCFLDVCYLVKHVLKDLDGYNSRIFGHFFMTDVNLSVIPFSDTKTRAYLPKIGFAALQDLDYCMRLPQNGDGFDQIYQRGEKVAWREPPVDYCNIISARKFPKDDHVSLYDYAIKSTATYIELLTINDPQAILGNIQSFYDTVAHQKEHGVCHRYYSVDALSFYLPRREINTYLASELFGKFSCICQNVPNKADVENLAIASLARDAQSIADIYNSLYYEMRDGFDDSYSAYVDDWQFVRDYGNSQMVTSYTNQTAAKLNIAEKNAKSMTSAGNQKSLIGRVDAQLRNLIRNINYGPMFAYGLVSAAKSHNLLNIIDGLIQENTSRWDQESAQTSLRREDYDRAKDDFDNRRKRNLFDNDAKRFGDYEYYLMLFEQHKLAMKCYTKLDEVLNLFRKQLEELTAAYYIKLNRVCDTLINTFEENRDALASEKIMQAKGSFSIPMMTIAELKNTLNAEIEQINVPGMFAAFMRLFLENEEPWIGEDESKIAEFVSVFFTQSVFGGFANRTITSFLKDKYSNVTDAQIANLLSGTYLPRLRKHNNAYYIMEESKVNKYPVTERCIVFLPVDSAPVRASVDIIQSIAPKWHSFGIAQWDQVAFLSVAYGIPLCARRGIDDMLRLHYSTSDPGRHLYEGKPVPNMSFGDWRYLPPIVPLSEINQDTVPYLIRDYTEKTIALYEQALQLGVLKEDGTIFECDENDVQAFKHLTEEIEKFLYDQGYGNTDKAEHLLKQLKETAKIGLTVSRLALEHNLNWDSSQKKQILLDHFGLSPVIQKEVENTCKDFLEHKRKAEILSYKLRSYLYLHLGSFEDRSSFIDFCQALFSGVITWEGRKVAYQKENCGIVSEVVLSERNDIFPFNAIPIYQGYLSYLNLLMPAEREKLRERSNDVLEKNPGKITETCSVLRSLLNTIGSSLLVSASAFDEKETIICFIQSLHKKLEEASS